MSRKAILPVLLAGMACSGAVQAATVNTLINIDGVSAPPEQRCDDLDQEFGTRSCNLTKQYVLGSDVFTSLAELEYRSAPGTIGIKGRLQFNRDTPGEAGGPISTVNFSHSYEDNLTFGILTGTLRLPVDIAGTVGIASAGGVSYAESSINVNVVNAGPPGILTDFVAQTGGLEFSETTGRRMAVLDIPILNGKATVTAGIGGRLQCSRSPAEGETCDVSFDYFNSARFLAATVLDETGAPVAAPTITASSGFDYLVGLDPHGDVSPIPLPAGIWLLGAGMMALLAKGRRRRPREIA